MSVFSLPSFFGMEMIDRKESETPDTWLLKSENGKPAIRNQFNTRVTQADCNISGRFFEELVDIFVDKGKLNREVVERFMTQRLASLRPQFANVAKTFAISCASSCSESARTLT